MNIPKWIIPIAAIVILGAIASVFVILFFVPSPTIVQYRITVALICFALSSVAGLLFAANVQIKGTIGVFSITLGGTAVLWLAALFIFNYIYPESAAVTGRVQEKLGMYGKIVKDGRSTNEGIMVGIIPGSNKTFTNSDGSYSIDVDSSENSYTGIAYFREGEEKRMYIGTVTLESNNGKPKGIFSATLER
jgi:predicted membrane channel-forming protein YqfA (hemolysin III family)